MKAKLLDGRLVSDFLISQVKSDVGALRSSGILPKLVIILVGDNAGSLSYIRQKMKASAECGIESEEVIFEPTITTAELIEKIEKLNADSSVHGILVQLPLPEHIDAPLVIRAIDAKKDVDGFHAYNLGKMFLSQEFEHLTPCTPRGIIEMLGYYKIVIEGKNVVIIGRSNIVGKPLSVMLMNRGATVTVCHSKTKNVIDHASRADILVVAIGKPKFVTAQYVKEGAVVIDVGVNRIVDEATKKTKLVGDVDFDDVLPIVSKITPVPGGVGPLTVACLMRNVVTAVNRRDVE